MLNFTELKLFGRLNFGDEVSVFDGWTISEDHHLIHLRGSKAKPEWFIGSGNNLTLIFYASKDNVPQETYRFRAEYYMKTDGEYYFLCSTAVLRAGLFL